MENNFKHIQRKYVSKKMAEASAFGVNPKTDTPAKKAKRVAAANQARQAGGTGSFMTDVKTLAPKKLKKNRGRNR